MNTERNKIQCENAPQQQMLRELMLSLWTPQKIADECGFLQRNRMGFVSHKNKTKKSAPRLLSIERK